MVIFYGNSTCSTNSPIGGQRSVVRERTVRRRLKEADFGTYVSKVILLRNKLKCLDFAKKFVGQPASFWNNVLWSDESSFEFHCSKKFFFVRLPKQYRKKGAPVCQRIWGCVAFTVLGDLVPVDGTMNQRKYLDVLNNHAFPSGDKLSPSYSSIPNLRSF